MSVATLGCSENRGKERDRRALESIENVTNNAKEEQVQVLYAILSRNADTEYLKRYGLNGRTDSEAFKKLLPVIGYSDVEPDIQRIANGDRSPILCALPISELLSSSGTSAGEQKLLPCTEEEFERSTLLYSLRRPVMNQYVQGQDKGKAMYFLFIRPETKTPCGLLVQSAVTSYYKSRYFKERAYNPYQVLTSPNETILCPDTYQSMYSQLLCGLLQNYEVLHVGAGYASGFIRPIRFLEQHWQQLCLDIKTGNLNNQITDPSVRASVMMFLKPNPDLAQLVCRECSSGSWKGIIPRLWPNAKYIEVIVTGTMAQYIPTLDYYSGGLPLVSLFYASSECCFGLNLNPFCKPSEVSYTLLPNLAYFEFIPVWGNEIDTSSVPTKLSEAEQEDIVDLIDVKLGHEYEVLVTTYTGLYRYRVEDILRVTGFHNAAPQFHFVCRKNAVLSIDSENTKEVELLKAVENSVKYLEPFGTKLIDYTSYADTSTIPGHYVLFWELCFGSKALPSSIIEQCCLSIEDSLNSVYRQLRVRDKSIGPLEIKVVKEGTFDQMMDFAIRRNTSLTQYKTPRCVKVSPILELLNARVTHSYFSTKYPNWIPGHKHWNNILL